MYRSVVMIFAFKQAYGAIFVAKFGKNAKFSICHAQNAHLNEKYEA